MGREFDGMFSINPMQTTSENKTKINKKSEGKINKQKFRGKYNFTHIF